MAVEIDVSTNKFPNEVMLIDEDDVEFIKSLGNILCATSNGKVSCTKYAKTSKSAYVHRLLTNCPKGLQVDHINGNGLDNRRHNLRIVTNKINSRNTALGISNTSGYIGVNYNKKTGKWEANIKVDYKKIHLGLFTDIEEAIKARKDAEKKYGFHENHGRKA